MLKMIKAVKKRWLKALKSGEYKKTKGVLHNDEGFCCLGVLIDIEYDGDWEREDGVCGSWSIQMEDGIAVFGIPCRVFTDKVGLNPYTRGKLIELNDENDTFDEVIEYIEKYL